MNKNFLNFNCLITERGVEAHNHQTVLDNNFPQLILSHTLQLTLSWKILSGNHGI